METLTLAPISRVDGEINLPGSKSLSNRVLLLAALAEGETEVSNLLASDDTSHMLNALGSLGVNCQLSDEGTSCLVRGNAGAFSPGDAVGMFLGNAGTAMRPLCAVLAASPGEYLLTGEPRMYERPIGDLVDALRQLGADIEYQDADGYPPLLVRGKLLDGGRVNISGEISSQYLTALLMAAPLAADDVDIEVVGELVSKPYIDITIDVMARFGVEVENRDYQFFRVAAGQRYRSPGQIMVEGDASSASYFLAAAAIAGGEVRVRGIGRNSVQGDRLFAEVLAAMGAEIEWGDEFVAAKRGELVGVDMDMNHIPDAAMTIATTALFAEGPTVIRNVENWRVKETDRLAAMATELRKVGAEVEEGRDYIRVQPPVELRSAAIDTYDDHRMAMCFSLAALGSVPITINDPGCTSKTFPDYFEKLESLCQYKT